MDDFNEVDTNIIEEKHDDIHEEKHEKKYEEKKNKGKSFAKSFLSMVSAGVVGSVLTLAIVPQTDFFQNLYEPASDQKAAESQTSNGRDVVQTKTVSSNTSTSSISDIIEKASTAIVGIVNMQQQSDPFSRTTETTESGSGSGVIFKKTADKAYIVTNNHVIEGASKIEVSLYNGQKSTAKLIGADALTDLAVLEINSKNVDNVLEFGDSATLRAGDQVLAIGNPLGDELSRTVTEGIISAVDRTVSVSTSAGDWDLDVIQTDAAINPGNSGGALLNTQGQVIGINSLKISENGVEGLGFAIPSSDVVPIVNEIIKTGQIERPYIGVSLANVEEIPQMYLQDLPKNVTTGAMVTYVDSNSAAAKAGLQKYDVIVSIGDQKVETSNDLRKFLYTKLKVGDKTTLKFYRDGKEKSISIKLTSTNAAS
jgi:serine protease Do